MYSNFPAEAAIDKLDPLNFDYLHDHLAQTYKTTTRKRGTSTRPIKLSCVRKGRKSSAVVTTPHAKNAVVKTAVKKGEFMEVLRNLLRLVLGEGQGKGKET